jgi:hypothetical protein
MKCNENTPAIGSHGPKELEVSTKEVNRLPPSERENGSQSQCSVDSGLSVSSASNQGGVVLQTATDDKPLERARGGCREEIFEERGTELARIAA